MTSDVPVWLIVVVVMAAFVMAGLATAWVVSRLRRNGNPGHSREGGDYDGRHYSRWRVDHDDRYQLSVSPCLFAPSEEGFKGLTSAVQQTDGTWLATAKTGQLWHWNGTVGDGARVVLQRDFRQMDGFTAKAMEEGLLSVALGPAGSVWTTYTTSSQTEGRKMDLVVDVDGQERLRWPFRENYHHGGTLVRSPVDGAMYLSTGDGGPQRDPFNTSQDPNAHEGKLWRLVDNPGQQTLGTEMVALGLRNAWKFSVDERGRAIIGDVGFDWAEELDRMPTLRPDRPTNFGWSIREGTLVFKRDEQPSSVNPELTEPWFEWPISNETGRATLGGYYVGGSDNVVAADFFGQVRLIDGDGVERAMVRVEDDKLHSMARGNDGTVYVLGAKCPFYRVDVRLPSE